MPTADPRDPSNPDRIVDRREERERVSIEIAGRLREREVSLSGTETSDELADMLTAVERFENSVSALGGDSMTNAPDSSTPDRPEFVVPARKPGESPEAYVNRVTEMAEELRLRTDD
jgi:hypothetical protein